MAEKRKTSKELSPEQVERFEQLKEEREKHDKIRNLKKSKFSHALIELNFRLSQYVAQFGAIAFENLIMQTLNDFKHEITVLATLKMIKEKAKGPVAIWDGKSIYIDPFVMREDYKSGSPELFTFTELYKER